MRPILGIDVGGANIKAAHTSGGARSIPFPLWKHPESLSGKLAEICNEMAPHDALAITMTGELCDCFANKREGVHAILRSVHAAAPNRPVRIWSRHHHFLSWQEAFDDPLSVAAANWLALGVWAAREFADEHVLLIDSGSTTTDILYLSRGNPEPRGYTDLERCQEGELVYTGVRRTPVCSVLGMEVAAELFATMLDAYVFLGLLPEAPDDLDTADGRALTRDLCHARLARMVCADPDTFPEEATRELAQRALTVQSQTVGRAIQRVLAGKPCVQRILLSGSGEVLGRSACALQAPLRNIPVTSLATRLGPDRSAAACAHAIAVLAATTETQA